MTLRYNAKFAFGYKVDKTYEEITELLRQLITKNAKFEWSKVRDQSYQRLIRTMQDPTIL